MIENKQIWYGKNGDTEQSQMEVYQYEVKKLEDEVDRIEFSLFNLND